jgi:bifunctional N-acetylglucosamine-1-phosphate-uridyltransferase/glucosamine-1-phosphate-acetyltransferase GlmU-like protein
LEATLADLYIIAAGKGSRMGGSIPKALVPITDKPNLTTTLQQIGYKFRKVFIVTNEQIHDQWSSYLLELAANYPMLYANVQHVPISSGRGDGHAVLEALTQTFGQNTSSDIVIAWGDVFFPQGEIIDVLLRPQLDWNTWGVIPVVKEVRPYVTVCVDEASNVTHADFAKLGETNEIGYHDQSVFRFDRDRLNNALSTMHHVLDKNGKYITGNHEMSLLHVFHYAANTNKRSGIVFQQTQYPTLSFNTVEEVAKIQKEIDEKWKHKFRNDQS